ncbi:MAG: tetratricopeptide repeat protein [Planctomycetes bacterium]|nr:tetratricopeptide repeat protein [Planctomycetota bacterium]
MKHGVSTERWKEIKRLFDAALVRDPTNRAAFLDRACDGDAALRTEIESLLASHEKVPNFLETPAAELLDEECEESLIGRHVGPYRIAKRIASGGMGTVYFAERADDAYRKQVAIKFIRGGVSTPAGVRRFVEERQTLANLDHPSIAKLLDGGTSDDGRPYLVMEYVDGIPIDAFCDSQGLGIESRLRLFLRVCDAVHHAHQNLIVHRDLKPANILVTIDGLPKLLDFGISTLVDRSAYRAPIVAGAESALPFVTPVYASPEQIRADPVTTASDVYSLGVILYELLAGRRPWDDGTKAVRAVRADGTEVAPDPPSRFSPKLAGDLDAIVLRALRADPARRYASVDHFAEDIRRHLQNQPVTARPQTLAYRASRFVRRNRVGAAAALLVLASFATGVIGTAWQARVAQRERDAEGVQRRIAESNLERAIVAERRAEEEALGARNQAEISDRVTHFLVDLFRTADPWSAKGNAGEVTARQLLDRGAASITDEWAAPPEVRAALLIAMGRVYTNLGLYDRAKELLHSAVDIGRLRLGTNSRTLIHGLDALGTAYSRTGERVSAEAAFREALEIARRRSDDSTDEVATELNNIGLVAEAQGDLVHAEWLFRQALASHRENGAGGAESVGNVLNNLGGVSFTKGDFARAERYFLAALAKEREVYAADHPNIGLGLNNLGLSRQGLGDLDGAARLYREALVIREHRLGRDHPDVAGSLNNLASVLYMKGNAEAAGALFRRALDVAKGRLGADHPIVIQLECNLGAVLFSGRDDAGAEKLWNDVLERRRRLLPPGHAQIADVLGLMAQVRLAHGDGAGAKVCLRECLAIRRATLPSGHATIAETENLFGAALVAEGHFADAERLLVSSFDVIRSTSGVDPELVADSRRRVVDLYRRWGKADLASRYAETPSTGGLSR